MAIDFESTSANQFFSGSAVFSAAPFTVSAWMKFESIGDFCAFWVGDNTVSSTGWLMRVDDSAPGGRVFRFRIESAGGTTQVDSVITWNIDTWYHCCIVEASATDHRLYVNGTNKYTGTASITPGGTNSTAIGVRNSSTKAMYFDGIIAHVGVWNVVLTDEEVATLANKISPLMVRRGSLVNYWPLNGNLATEVDIVGGVNLTKNGTPALAEEPPIPYSRKMSV